jgi:hypothetical protein
MSNIGPEGRSFARIERQDLDRLAEIASADLRAFFNAHPDWATLYENRYLATALCQGAALHYIDGTTGIQDFDVYSFFASHPARRWYAKRNKQVDLGDAKFGHSPDRPSFVGRRVDLLGRGIEASTGEPPAVSIQKWLRRSATVSAQLLAKKAVVLLDPVQWRGQVIWPPAADSPAV